MIACLFEVEINTNFCVSAERKMPSFQFRHLYLEELNLSTGRS